LWARDNTPKDARLGVNDAGALAFYSERPTFDVVGLTTKGESRHWVEGPGSRFEHYEHLPRALLPSHWIVYPEWFAIPPLLGEHLTSRTVNATILGGHTMSAHLMDASALGSGNLPDLHALPSFALVLPDSEDRGAGVTDDEARAASRRLTDGFDRIIVDRLDIADLESESEHAYERLFTRASHNRVYEFGSRADGGRAGRTHDLFVLEISPGGDIVGRWVSDTPTTLTLSVDGTERGSVALPGGGHWVHAVFPLGDVAGGPARIEVRRVSGDTFASLHYWSRR
jgi:hypothetical protein